MHIFRFGSMPLHCSTGGTFTFTFSMLDGAAQEGWIDSATFRDLPYDYATLLENLFDVGHVPFTHHASVSKRSSADVIKLDVKQQDITGFEGRNERGPRKGQLGYDPWSCVLMHSIAGNVADVTEGRECLDISCSQ